MLLDDHHASPKTLVISDLHLHEWSYGAHTNEYGMNSRLANQWQVLEEFLAYVEDEDQVVCCGDVFHTHNSMTAQAMYVAHDFFKKLVDRCKQVTVLVGNHDMSSRHPGINSLQWLSSIVTRLVTYEDTWEFEGQHCRAKAYTEDKSRLQTFLAESPQDSLVFLHQGVSGVDIGNGFVLKNEILSAGMVPDTVSCCFTGHYHVPQTIKENLRVIGAPMHHTWSDVGRSTGFWSTSSGHTIFLELLEGYRFAYEESSGAGVHNHFIRSTDKLNQQHVRERYLNEGAVSVEFVSAPSTPLTGIAPEFTSLHAAVAALQENAEPRTREVGKSIRENTYEIPESLR